jgi:UDPglucose 6-dehydrogenase
MRITVVGSGYVGLVSGACLADVGMFVTCLDVSEEKIRILKSGEVPFFEPGLDALVTANRQAGRLSFTTSYDEALAAADVVFVAVGTPPQEDGSADLSHVLDVARQIGKRILSRLTIVNKSTVPVGTAEKVRGVVAAELAARGLEIPFAVVSNPEFLKEGAAIDDFMRPERIIVGSDDDHATDMLRRIYAPFSRNRDKIILMDVRSAELTKYAANAMLATRISFMNELANLAERLGADIEAVRHGIGGDPRIGSHFLYAGCGFGGSCFPKDIRSLLTTAENVGGDLKVLRAVHEANEYQRTVLFGKMHEFYSDRGGLAGKIVALWGLAFKPNTDDMREAPSLDLIRLLLSAGASVRAYDPAAADRARAIFRDTPGITICGSAIEATERASCLAVVTEWKEFRRPNFVSLANRLADRVIFDGRNLYQPSELHDIDPPLHYLAIGRAVSPGCHMVDPDVGGVTRFKGRPRLGDCIGFL